MTSSHPPKTSFASAKHPIQSSEPSLGQRVLFWIGKIKTRKLVMFENYPRVSIPVPSMIGAVAHNASNASSSKHSFAASFAPDAQCQQMRLIEVGVRLGFHRYLEGSFFGGASLASDDRGDSFRNSSRVISTTGIQPGW